MVGNRQIRRYRWHLLLLGIAMLIGLVLVGVFYFSHKILQAPVQQVQEQPLVLKNTQKYQYLRDVLLLGNHFVMLRHLPTGQRLILLSQKHLTDKMYHQLFEQPLLPLHVTLLMQVFKSQTGFKEKAVRIQTVTLKTTGRVAANGFEMPYRVYEIKAFVNRQPETFEAYLGEIGEAGRIRGLVFAFNSEHGFSTQALTDLLHALRPSVQVSPAA